MNARVILPLLGLADFVGVILGYAGIERLRRFHFVPFHDSLFNLCCAFSPPPNWFVLAWDSIIGRLLIWPCSILLPVMALHLLINRERHAAATVIMSFWTVAFGLGGLWIWLATRLNTMGMH